MESKERRQGKAQGLYRREYEHDACGVGMVADLSGTPGRRIVELGLTVLKRLMHRGAAGNDPETGDGAGLLVKIPRGFFSKCLPSPPDGPFGIAMIFGGEGEEDRIGAAVEGEGCKVLAWRDVPVDPSAAGRAARAAMPRIRQLFIGAPDSGGKALERLLYVVRRQIEKAAPGAYVCSCSARTIVYKGLLLATQIEKFYSDLSDPDFVSPFAIVHQRYSTNTFPSWELAHPFRALAHNGEINAIRGNLNALAAREASLASPAFGADMAKLLPVVRGGQSDSASLDGMFELLVAAGRDAPHAMMMLIPQAWGAKYRMGHDIRAFCEYHSALMEPWDGPAAVAFTDGAGIGAALDRNGLRPARWTLSKDGLFVLASETGVTDIPPESVARHGRLRPGSILWLDLEKHRLAEDAELKALYARRRPYRRWVEENRIPVTGLFAEIVPSAAPADGCGGDALLREQLRAGWTREDVEDVLRPMAETGREPAGAMGCDAALAAIDARPRSLFDHFHQLFAQVTNPPIDPIREELVMSIMTYIGNRGDILSETPGHAKLVKMTRPVLTDDELSRLRNVPGFPAKTLPLSAGARIDGPGWLKAALDRLAAAAVAAADGGAKIIILSDRDAGAARVPPLLAVAAVNKALVASGARPSTGIVVESGEVREVHHFAVLLGFGATAVNPWLALAAVSRFDGLDARRATANYVSAVCKGLMKIMSKMGVSTLRSYRPARMFAAVGLGPGIVSEYFAGVASPVGGLELKDIEKAASAGGGALPALSALPAGGAYRPCPGGTAHLWTPQRAACLRQAVRNGDYDMFKRYTAGIDRDSRVTLRSQLEFAKPERACAAGERNVEPADAIAKRFAGAAMSLGSISPEAHETIAVALNRLGAMSNSGEGGEDPARFGTERNSAVKQVASGRFGVTVEYLASAKDLQIKIAQGAKPGEGGQLPARKVDGLVARLRHAKPGTTLISPPPHHDIYSIEDLAQLVVDLKCANPGARVSVKLVSQPGVGTVAAGVAKAHADAIVVSGFDGGTGAAPLSSMAHAGMPWETGLAEAHQTLVKNGLRDRVKLQVDGQLRTGRDIVIAAMLGADEFAFGSSILVALGCVQCRNCNLNRCPAGIATQDAALRAKFAGRPEDVQTYFMFLARETREHLAALGLASLAEARGRADLLKPKAGTRFDFGDMLAAAAAPGPQDPAPAPAAFESYDARELIPFLSQSGETRLVRTISNRDRSVGAALSGHLAKARLAALPPPGPDSPSSPVPGPVPSPDSPYSPVPGPVPSPDGRSVFVQFRGVAGQSFGAFLAAGVTFELAGEANDYVGKSLSGGTIIVRPPENAAFAPEDNAIAGNAVAYGATSGRIFIEGQVGERFGIRNSGAVLVVEGAGDHGCEYMTGGVAVVLGPVGVNFAAGMTGGTAFVYDKDGDLDLNCNLDSVDLFPVGEGSVDEALLLELLRDFARLAGSRKAARMLADWDAHRPLFAKVSPAPS